MAFTIYNRKKWRILAAGCIALAALGISFFWEPVKMYAYEPVAGVVNDGPVQIRKAPVNGEKLGLLYKETAVTVIDETNGTDGCVWYQIQVSVNDSVITGYVRSDFITPQAAGAGSPQGDGSAEEQEYITALQNLGFPVSYCEPLLALHKKYPNWQFVPVQTELDWSTVIENESLAGRNLIQKAVNDARKSTDSAAYDWATNTWYGYDGAGWVCASPEYIAYCMDPRNFLNEMYIFQFETLEYAEYQKVDGVANMLANTFMSGNYADTDGKTRSYADTFFEVGGNLAVSPYHLAARCKQEQGLKGTSPLISGHYEGYEGYYNYFNVGAYTTSNATSIVNGLIYAKKQGWNSIYNSIAGGSAVVANNYIKKGQNTIYFEKFNVVYKEKLYSHQYMTNLQAAMSEGSNMGKAYADKNQAFVFRIPVYQNMPESAVTFADKGNPNNWLSSITVDGYSLTPVFHGATTAYTLVVESGVDSIQVDAAAVAKTSQISGVGKYELNYGNNTINVNCVSQSGETRTYTITVARQQAAGDDTQVNPYEAVIYGDINGDGKISNADIVLLQKHILGITKLSGSSLSAADISKEGEISNKDLVLLQKHILGISEISQ